MATRMRATPIISSAAENPRILIPRTVPYSVDELERVEGWRLWDRMQRCVYVWAADRYLRDRILENGVSISPNIDAPPPGTPVSADAFAEFTKAAEIAVFVERAFEELIYKRNGLTHTLRQMHSWLRYGHSLAEITFTKINDEDFGRMIGFECIRHLPRENYRLVNDVHGRFLGAIGFSATFQGTGMIEGLIPNPEILENFVTAERLALIMPNPSDVGRFGGVSAYKAAYDPYAHLVNMAPVEYKNANNFAGQSLVAVGPPEGFNVPAGNTDQTKTVNELILDAITGLESNSCVVLPNGTVIEKLGSEKSEVFAEHATRKGREIIMSILYSARTLMESTKNSQADAGAAQDIADVAVSAAQHSIAEVIRYQIIRPLVILNFGREAAARYTPRVNMRNAGANDIPSLLTALSSAKSSGLMSDAMLHTAMPKWCGIPYIPGERTENRSVGDEEQNSRGTRD